MEDIRKSLEILFETGCQIGSVQVQGGEPFCYSDLPALLDDLGAKKQEKRIRNLVIATNGSIMPSDEVFQTLQKHNIEVRISDYNVAHEKAAAFAQQCKERHIRCTFYDFASGQGQWYNLGGKAVKRENDDAVVEDRYAHCAFRNCLTLEDGKLAYCSRALNAQVIQGFSGVSGDYLEISDRPDFREELRAYLRKPHFMEACRYCNGTQDDHMIPCAIQIGSEK